MDAILGRRLASSEQKNQKIGVFSGLPAMGLDGLSSSAYGPEAALTMLIPLGAAGLHLIEPITLAILALLVMLYFSYRQTIEAYPLNGGSYTVAKENLGIWPGLLAAASLMIDYVLTVAVGISAGVAALVSAIPELHRYTLVICLVILALITFANLRGTGEAGAAFAVPTYLFILCMAIVLGMGIFRMITSGGHPTAVIPAPPLPKAAQGLSIWIILRAFASGCAAMTGVEAVSNGVSAFKDPAVKNAHRTLTAIVAILALLLGGIAFLCRGYHIGAMNQEHGGYQSVLSQLTMAVIGRGWFYKITIASILSVLCLSANTSFVGFPRLCRLIAKDDFLPRSFAAAGRRLVYWIGVLFLAASAGVLLAVFGGITDKLIPLYAVGAFLAFTLSQAGMVIHWLNAKNAHTKLIVNALGSVATGCAVVIILIAKFTEGAWITVLVIPLMLLIFHAVHHHYGLVDRHIAGIEPLDVKHNQSPAVLIPIDRWNKPVAKSIRFAMHLSADVTAIHLTKLEGDEADDEVSKMKQVWADNVESPAKSANLPVPKLEFAKTPYREFITPLLAQIDRIKSDCPDRVVAVILPELIETHWWQSLLHTHHAMMLRRALRARQDARVVVVEVPWFIPS